MLIQRVIHNIETQEGATQMKKMLEAIKEIVIELHREIEIYRTIQRFHRNSRRARMGEAK